MTTKDWVFEVIHEDFPTWEGNQLYDTKDYAKFCGVQDYQDTIVSARDKKLTWEPIMRDTMHLYVDDVPTGVALKIRHVNSLGK